MIFFSPQIVIPTNQQTATIMPTAQPLLLNQMPVLAPGVQFILRPQTTAATTAKLPTAPTHMPTATPQGLILQPAGGQSLLQLQPPPRSQPMVRVLANGLQLAAAPPTTTYVTHLANSQHPQQQTVVTVGFHFLQKLIIFLKIYKKVNSFMRVELIGSKLKKCRQELEF